MCIRDRSGVALQEPAVSRIPLSRTPLSIARGGEHCELTLLRMQTTDMWDDTQRSLFVMQRSPYKAAQSSPQ
eukprot:7054457-Pyramimonas_sp.AAC.1